MTKINLNQKIRHITHKHIIKKPESLKEARTNLLNFIINTKRSLDRFHIYKITEPSSTIKKITKFKKK